MPNVQFSLSGADYVDLFSAGEVLGLSDGRLARALCLAYLKQIEPTASNLIQLAGGEKRPRNKPREML